MNTLIDREGPIVRALQELVQALADGGRIDSPPAPTECRLSAIAGFVKLMTDGYTVTYSPRSEAPTPIPADQYVDWSDILSLKGD